MLEDNWKQRQVTEAGHPSAVEAAIELPGIQRVQKAWKDASGVVEYSVINRP